MALLLLVKKKWRYFCWLRKSGASLIPFSVAVVAAFAIPVILVEAGCGSRGAVVVDVVVTMVTIIAPEKVLLNTG